ncbi:protein kinase domain-containing protein [Streptomyces sp. WM6372]|uniref:serine/threonine-protein kinase n=1 Tax=Streptomyces sp. WM6372 TaxID=1415555 RepID=UPI00131A98F7|nr:protein kinase [Streptomyces sp. WM6372]
MSGGFAVRVGDELAGRYRLERRLGQGGMGEVWRGHDLMLDRSVAVKVLLEAATNDEVVARFRREATIGARLQHPGITVVHDVGQQDGRLFIVMELLSGEDLAAVLARDGALAVDLAVELAAQTAEALAVAHEQAVVHRDLKPGNLFLLPGRRIKICDFGIAHSADATAGWTVTGRIIGTPAYMAPEQWRGERVGARCDLYALGCVLYALVSGAPPFGQTEGPYVLMHRHVAEAPLPLREAGTPVPAELDRLVLALLAKDPADRPESAEAVGKALRGLRGGEDGDGPGPGYARPGPGPGPVSGQEPGPGPGAGSEAGGEEAPGPRPGPEAGAGAGAGQVPGPGFGTGPVARVAAAPGAADGVGPEVREFVRGLLAEAEDALRELPGGADARVEVLAIAADAAARFDADLAARLLADAERAAWAGGGGDGARVARLLTVLARNTAPHAPARARRLLTDAQQALFTVPGSRREGPLRALAEELIKVAPEQASRIAGYHLGGRPAPGGLRARIEAALAAERPEEAEQRLTLIQDPGQRAAATYDTVLAVAPRDLESALRLSERIGSAGARLLALCQVARDRAEAGDAAGGARALEQAEEELPRFLEERAAWLREEAAHHAEQGRLATAERLRTQADALLRHHPEEAADEKAAHALSTLAEARAGVRQAALRPLDPAAAREGAGAARALPDPAVRARALVRTARECLATDRMPWLAEASADAGAPPPPGTTALGGRDTGPAVAPAAPGIRAWHTGARPDALYAAGAHVVWRSGTEVGCVRADAGTTRWTAYADEGTSAPPLPGAGSLRVSCVADAATVYVDVRRDDGPGARIVAREPRDGRVRWWRDLPRDGLLRGAGPVLVHDAQGELTVLRAATGEVEWRRSLPEGTRSLAAVGDCLVLGDDLWLQGVHLPSGRRLWATLRDSPLWRSPPLDRTAGAQPLHLVDGMSLRALERGSGREMWECTLGAPAQRLLVEHGVVYAAARSVSQGDLVTAFDARTGKPRWQRTVIRSEGRECALELLGLRAGGLYVKAARGGRRGRLGRQSGPFVAVLDPVTGKPRRQWEQPELADGDTLLVGDRLVLSRPELSAYALP